MWLVSRIFSCKEKFFLHDLRLLKLICVLQMVDIASILTGCGHTQIRSEIGVNFFSCEERFFILHDLRLLRSTCILQTVSALKRGVGFCQAFLVRRRIFCFT